MIPPEAGTSIGEKYVLIDKISEGGGGVVWHARQIPPHPPLLKGGQSFHPPLEKGGWGDFEVALKVLKLSPLKSKEALTDRFKREFELFKKVSHPNIAKIYDFGFDLDHDIYYFTSELLLGGDLRKMIGAPIPVIEYLLLCALRALEYLGSFGILHLDIKPQNLLLRTNPPSPPFEKGGLGGFKPDLALIDFGLAGFNPPDRPGGTPNYMPPEIVLKRLQIPPIPPLEKGGMGGFPIDHRSDLYSLGVTFYYILSGIQPFAVMDDGGRLDSDATMRRHIGDERPPPPSFYNPQVPSYLDAIIMHMIAKNPDERYQAAILAAQALCFRSPNRLEPESRETISAYLPEEGVLIGRHEERETLEKLISDAAKGEGKSLPIACIVGAWGTGKTRLLQSLKPFAQQHEMEVLENLRRENLDLRRPTAFLIDDPFLPQSSIDITSLPDIYPLKNLIRYILQMPKARFFLVVTINPDLMPLKDVLRQMEVDPSLCAIVDLKNFTVSEITEYLTHLLGEPPSEKIMEELHQATFGNPRFIVDLFKRMMKRGEFFSYFAGRPGVETLESMGFSFSHVASPPSLAEHLLGLVKELPRGAKLLAHRLACWQRPISINELFSTTPSPLEGDLSNLLSSGLVKRNEDGRFVFTNPLASKIIEAGLDQKERMTIHDSIVDYLRKIPPHPPLEKGGEGGFEISLHLAFGSDPNLQKDAARRLAIEALKRLHPAETAELLRAVDSVIASVSTAHPELVSKGERHIWDVRAEILVREGQALVRLGRWDDAKATFERLRNLVPPLCKGREGGVDPEFKLNLRADEQIGLLAMRRRELSEARTIFTRALETMKNNPQFAIRNPQYDVQLLRLENYLAGVDLREGHYEKAAETYARTANLAQKLASEYRDQVTNNELGETNIALGKIKEAIKILESELEWSKKADHRERIVNRLRLLGDAHRRMKDYQAAQGYYTQALDLSREYHLFENRLRIHNSFANLQKQMGKWEEAIEQYKPALDLAMQIEGKATSVDIMANIGLIYNKLGQHDNAIEYLELALDFAKGPEAESSTQVRNVIPYIHVALGHAHYEKKEFDEAERHLNVALGHHLKNPLSDTATYNLYGTLAEIDLARGNPKKARERLPVLKKLVSKIPEAADHFKNLVKKIEGS